MQRLLKGGSLEMEAKRICSLFTVMVGLILVFSLILPFKSFAQKDLHQEIKELKDRIEQLEQKVKKGQQERSQIQKEKKELKAIKEKFEHLSIGGGVTGIIQGAEIDNDWKSHSPIDGSYSADLELEVDMEKWGTGFLHLETGDGDNVTDEIGALTGSNADAMGDKENDFEISEALWSFGLLENKIKLTAGKLDPVTLVDNNLVAKDETTQFLADIFVDQLAMEWPDDYTPGMQIILAPNEIFDVKMAALSADTDWEDIFDNMFYAGEIALHPQFKGLKGNYRLYGWVNDRQHVEWRDINSKNLSKQNSISNDEENYGIGLSVDQQISSDITLFARYGWQNDDAAVTMHNWKIDDFEPYGKIEQSWSVGGQITGQGWDRENDVLGLAFGMAILNDDYEDYLEDNNLLTGGKDSDAEDELHFEIYYSLFLNKYLSISPDFQVIENPRGDGDADTVYIGSLRTQFSF